MHEISIVLHIAMTLMLVLLGAYVVYMCSLAHVGICTRKDAESGVEMAAATKMLISA